MKKYKIVVLSAVSCVLLLGGCAYAKNDIPNLGSLSMKSWQSFDDPNYGNGHIQAFIMHDNEKDMDYIVVETAQGDVAITERK